MKKILYAAAECTPFIKTGGLGDVVGSLPKELNHQKYDVRIVIPEYLCIDETWRRQMKNEVSFCLDLNWRRQRVQVKSLNFQGILFYFIGNEYYFKGESPYSDMGTDLEKFSYFSKAVLEMLSYLEFEPDLIHCHDWQTALIPVYLKTIFSNNPFYQSIQTIMTIHNLRFQGIADLDFMKDVTGLPETVFTYDKLEFYQSGNLLKGGIAFADKITTVSKTYAEEIQEPEYGEGLDDLLRYRKEDLCGIINGIDYQIYSPSSDQFIKYHYDSKTLKKAKKNNKYFLQNKVHLPSDKNIFVIGIIARLTSQKGFDLLQNIMDRLFSLPIQLIVLGSGEKDLEEMFFRYAQKYPDQLSLHLQYNDALAKLMYAGCDAVLMPSSFEPCGLCQLMALRYGTIPIVRFTGGLKDTVVQYHENYHTGTGFGFDQYDSEELYTAILRAFHLYTQHPARWNEMAERDMQLNYSWRISCKNYEQIYDAMMEVF